MKGPRRAMCLGPSRSTLATAPLTATPRPIAVIGRRGSGVVDDGGDRGFRFPVEEEVRPEKSLTI